MDNNELEKQIEEKISEMESPSYQYPDRFNKKDYIFAAVVALASLALVIWGAFL